MHRSSLQPLSRIASFFTAAALTLPVVAADPPKSGANRQPPEAEQKQQKNASADAVSQLGMAYSLAQYGRDRKSPLALLSAAEILQHVPAEMMKNKPKTEAGKAAETKTAKKKERPEETADSLIAEARKLADDRYVIATN